MGRTTEIQKPKEKRFVIFWSRWGSKRS